MTNILLTLSYDGTDFCGWQKQKDVRSVQGELEKALQKMLNSHVKVVGSGRTDSGVHAAGQAATFLSPHDSIPEENYIRALNSILPSDIRTHNARKVPLAFSARFNATSRVYRYFIQTKVAPLASENRYRLFIPRELNTSVLNEMCGCLSGERDFSAFCASGDQSLSKKRFIYGASFSRDEENPSLLVFQVEANAFLWKMVRSLVGTLIYLEGQGKGKEDFERIIANCDRGKAGPTAPAKGLFLWEIKFSGIRVHP